MKSYLHYILIFATAFAFTSCEKEHLPPDSEGPVVISLDGMLDSITPVHMAAGKLADAADNLTYYKDSMWVFRNDLYDTITNGKGLFWFSINNYKKGQGKLTDDVEQTVKAGTFTYEHNTKPIPLQVCVGLQTAQGDIASTFYCTQPPTATFQIMNAETVVKDGIKYRKATISFSCKLSDQFGMNKHTLNGTAVMVFLAGN